MGTTTGTGIFSMRLAIYTHMLETDGGGGRDFPVSTNDSGGFDVQDPWR